MGSSIGVLHEVLKSAPHIYIFLAENFIDSRQFSRYDFGIFSAFLYVYYAEQKFCHKYTHALSPVWNRPPPYTRIIREENFAQIYMENCGAFGIWARLIERWYLGICLFAFCICGHRVENIGFVHWLMSKFDCKSVMRLHKFIVKMWLWGCNCMCICVCIWYWL